MSCKTNYNKDRKAHLLEQISRTLNVECCALFRLQIVSLLLSELSTLC